MRSAEDICRSNGKLPKVLGEDVLPLHFVIKIINEARKEAIEHCASKITYPVYDFNGNLCNDRVKKIILKQIEELK